MSCDCTHTFQADKPGEGYIEITGLGYFAVRINGMEITRDRFVPALSDYEKRDLSSLLYPISDTFTHRIYFLRYDCTQALKAGENKIEIRLGNGFYRQTERIAEGRMEYGQDLKTAFCLVFEDTTGRREVFSDGTELWAESEIVSSHLFIGEEHDARKLGQIPQWKPVHLLPAPQSELTLQTCPADRVIQTLCPVLLKEYENRRIYDAGENISGNVRITTGAPSGTQIRLRFAENCVDGELDFSTTGSDYVCASGRKQIMEDVFICDGEKRSFEPLFVWHAFRYFEVVSPVDDLEVQVIHSNTPVNSTFESDAEGLNWLYKAFLRTQLNNMHGGVPSDCPHRERLGYTGDGQVCAEATMLTTQSREFYRKWIQDILDCQDVPCIQTLSHLSHMSSWEPYKAKMQDGCTMRIGDESVYQFVRKCLHYCKELFGTSRIHIGMDEAPVGKEQYLQHFARVFQICREEGIQPDFWADAFYLEGRKDEVPGELFDGTQTPVYWEYYETNPEAYRNIFARLKKAAGKVSFAGCLHKHMGIAPDNGLSQTVMDVAFPVAKEAGVTDILMTTWGDNGNECPFYAILPAFWYAAHKLYPCTADLDAMVSAYTGYTWAQWQIADELNYIVRIDKKICNASVWALHNDLLIGMMDCHISDDADEHYRKLCSQLQPLCQKDSQFAYIFRFYAALCDVMARKTTFSKRLRRAYMAGDRQTLQAMQKKLPELQQKIEDFRRVFRILWMKDNKGFGFEVMDLRFGGMAARCQTAYDVLEDYLCGRLERIYELEEERLPYWADALEEEHRYAPWFFHWSKSFTENDII